MSTDTPLVLHSGSRNANPLPDKAMDTGLAAGVAAIDQKPVLDQDDIPGTEAGFSISSGSGDATMQDETQAQSTAHVVRNGHLRPLEVFGVMKALQLRPFSTIRSKPVPWLWEHRLASGMFTPLVGDGGAGKGYICTDLIARLSRGDAMPDGSPNPFRGVPRSSIILESEDAADYTLKPRLEQQGADTSKVYFLEVKNDETFDFSRHLSELEAHVSAHSDLAFIMISAVNDFLPPGVKTGVDNEVRRLVLAPLMGFLQRTGLASLGIHHIGKATDRGAHHRTLDSVAYYNKPRLMLGAIVTDRQDGGDTVGELGGLKSNLGPVAPDLGYVIDANGLRWTGPTGNRMKELFEREFKAHEGPSKLSQAEDFLAEMLGGGPVDRTEVERKVSRAGFSGATLRRARENLGIMTVTTHGGPGGGSTSQWQLPERRAQALIHPK